MAYTDTSFFAKLKSDFLDSIFSFLNMLVLGIILMLLVPNIFEKIKTYGKESNNNRDIEHKKEQKENQRYTAGYQADKRVKKKSETGH